MSPTYEQTGILRAGKKYTEIFCYRGGDKENRRQEKEFGAEVFKLFGDLEGLREDNKRKRKCGRKKNNPRRGKTVICDEEGRKGKQDDGADKNSFIFAVHREDARQYE